MVVWGVHTLLQELTQIPVFIDEVQRKLGLAIALIEGVDHKWHVQPEKPKKPPVLLFAGTPVLGDDALNLSDHELGKIQKILIPGFSVFELRGTLRKLPGLSQTKVVDLWLLWSFLAGVPAYYGQLWKLKKLQALVKPFRSLDSQSIEELDELFAYAADEYSHLTTHLPNDKARGVLASLSMKVHPGNEINECLKILQEKGLIEEWVDLAMTKEGSLAKQHVVAPGFLRNVMIIHNGLTNKAALVGDLQGRGLEQMVAGLVMELHSYGVCPFPFESASKRIKAWQVTSSQADVDGIFELDDHRLVIYDLKHHSGDFFTKAAAPIQGNKGKGQGKATSARDEKTEVTVHGMATQIDQELQHFETFLKRNVLPHIEAITKISQCTINHVHVVALAGFMDHSGQEILARMNKAAQFVGVGANVTCHVDSLEAFEARCDDAKVEFPIFRQDGEWPLIARPIFKKVHEALERAIVLEQPLLLRGTRRCGKSCCLRYLQGEYPNAKYLL